MAHARHVIELAVRIGNRPGELAKLWSAISQVGLNILAYCAYSDRSEGVVLFVTEDAPTTRRALETAGYDCKENPVVLVSAVDHVGAVAALGACLGAAGINILYSYASSSGTNRFHAVFKTDDDTAAIRLLETGALRDAA